MNYNYNTISCLVIFTNIFHLYLKKNDLYYFLSFVLLFFSSILFHETRNDYIKIVDYLFVFNVIIKGGIVFFYNYKPDFTSLVIIVTFLFVVLIHTYEIIYKPRNTVDFHALLHLMGSIGQNFVISLL